MLEDNEMRGQQEERTTGGEDSRRSGQQEEWTVGGQREEWTATRVDTKQGSINI